MDFITKLRRRSRGRHRKPTPPRTFWMWWR